MLLFSLALIGALIFAYIYLATIVSRLFPTPQVVAGVSVSMMVDELTAYGAKISHISMEHELFSLHIESVQAEWTLLGLFRHEMTSLRVENAEMDLFMKDVSSEKDEKRAFQLFPFEINRFAIQHAGVRLWHGGDSVETAENRVELRDIFLETPVFYQKAAGIARDGRFSVESVLLNGAAVGSISGELYARNTAYDFSGELTFAAELSRDAVSMQLAAKGGLEWTSGHMRIPVHVSVTNGEVRSADGSFVLSGLRVDVASADIMQGQTKPAQQVHIAEARMKEMMVRDIRLAGQLEAWDTLFVEEGSASWCGGKLRLYALRLRPDMRSEGTIYCEQLALRELLRQIGFEDVIADARLSGRLPAQVAGEEIRIQDGELYSYPGVQGTLKIGQSDLLTAGVSADAPAYGSILFTQQALKDFVFDWLRMSINTEGGNVRLELTVFGRPAKPLPFRYDAQLGSFLKVEARAAQLIDQPIELTLTVRIPVRGFFYNWKGLNRYLKSL